MLAFSLSPPRSSGSAHARHRGRHDNGRWRAGMADSGECLGRAGGVEDARVAAPIAEPGGPPPARLTAGRRALSRKRGGRARSGSTPPCFARCARAAGRLPRGRRRPRGPAPPGHAHMQSVPGMVLKALDQRGKHCEPQAADGLALGHAPFLVAVANRQIEPVEEFAAKQRRRLLQCVGRTPRRHHRRAVTVRTGGQRRRSRARCRPVAGPPTRLAPPSLSSGRILLRHQRAPPAGHRARPRRESHSRSRRCGCPVAIR